MSLENPNYFNAQDRARYEHLFYRNNNNLPLTTIEEDFVRSMYKQEEIAYDLATHGEGDSINNEN